MNPLMSHDCPSSILFLYTITFILGLHVTNFV
jgi:type III secretory pathway component EscR